MCHPRSILKVGGRGTLTHVPPQINPQGRGEGGINTCATPDQFSILVPGVSSKKEKYHFAFFFQSFAKIFQPMRNFREIFFCEILLFVFAFSLHSFSRNIANKLVKYKRKILPFFRWMFCSLENLFVPNRLTTYLVCATPDQSSRDGWGPQYMFHSILIFLVKDLSQSPNLLN